MKNIKDANIFRQNEGPEKRSVGLTLHDDGSIEMHTHDDGPTALQTWGKEEYEFWTNIPPDAVSLLAFVLLRERYLGHDSATDELSKLCKENAVPHKWESYP